MPPSRPWALITPASRGIGRALARQLLQTTRVPVVATARGSLDEARDGILTDLKGNDLERRLKMIKMDFLEEDSIKSAAEECKSLFPPGNEGEEGSDRWHMHLGYCIPGVLFPEKAPSQVDAKDALVTMQTNVLGPLLAIKHFSQFLPRKSATFEPEEELEGLPRQAVWANMSARVGSTGDNRLGGLYSYRASKAAVNQLTKTFDIHLNMQSGGNAIAVALHPGTVKTELTKHFGNSVKKEQLNTPESAAERLVDVVKGLSGDSARGKCWDWKGEVIPP